MKLQTILLTRGLPASGKTTFAKAWVAERPTERARVNRDDLRAMLFETPTYEWHQERAVTEVQRAAVKALLAGGMDVVCDDTNLRPKYVREWERFARGNGATVELREFPVDVDEAIRRDAARDRTVGEDVIRRMASKFMRKGEFLPIPAEVETTVIVDKYEPRPDLPGAVMVDIDGTLAHHGGRDIYDLSRAHEDTPNRGVVAAVQSAAADGLAIIYCSGREDLSRDVTASWIARHVGVAGPLYMRPSDDKRKDSIVKRELFDEHIRDQFDVLYVLDDRNQVVDMWRELGLTCFQVAPGDF